MDLARVWAGAVLRGTWFVSPCQTDKQIRQPSSKGFRVKRIILASCFLQESETWNRNVNTQAVVSGLL